MLKIKKIVRVWITAENWFNKKFGFFFTNGNKRRHHVSTFDESEIYSEPKIKTTYPKHPAKNVDDWLKHIYDKRYEH